MDRDSVVEGLRTFVEDYFTARGLDLIELSSRYEANRLILRVLVDRPEGGISIGECAEINHELSRIFDEKDMLQESYMLEVSSPGLDRPLILKKDFLRCLNKNARFFFTEPVNTKFEVEGIIKEVSEDAVGIDISGEVLKVSLSKIRKAKQTF